MLLRTLAVATLLMSLASCASTSPATSPAPSPDPSPDPSRDPSAEASSPPKDRLTAREIVKDPRSRLSDVRVRRLGTGLEVAAWWQLNVDGRSRGAIATSGDGFATGTYERWTEAWFRPPEDLPEPPRSERLLSWRLPVLDRASDLLVYALGGDGATLFPFQRVARSSDDGETWDDVEVDLGVEPRGHLNGGVALSDGRLLVLVGNFSDDRPGRPSSEHHGLWVSDGTDWSSYRPVEPSYDPPVDRPAGAYPTVTTLEATSEGGPVIWSTTSGGQLYVSTDDGLTFREVPAR